MRRINQTLLVLAAVFIFLIGTAAPSRAIATDLLITGVIDGPLTGGLPKAVELYVVNDIPDLSIFGIGGANNGGGSDGEEFTFPADAATAGQFIYVATESIEFTNFFGFAPDYTDGTAVSINGDDAVELFQNGAVIDTFGDINVDGTGQPWEYLDGWAYRVSGTEADGTIFNIANWTFSGPDALDGETSNATAAIPFPTGTFAPLAGDAAPGVASTDPTNGAAGVAIDANVTINFTEDVTVTGSWFDIACTVSGAHTAVASGGPASYTLDPDTDFANGENCTVTVFAAQVTDDDTDDPPDNMSADVSFSFDTVSLNISSVVINEFLADPATDLAGDANGDGIRDASDDEFIEIVNVSGTALDVSGWSISDAVQVRHTFPTGSIIPADCAAVVFGGDTPTGEFGGAVVQTASTGSLGLNNGGDTLLLDNGAASTLEYVYGSEGGNDQSLTREPDISGTFVLHSDAAASGGALFSPGTQLDGTAFSGCNFGAAEPKLNEFSASTTGTDVEYVEVFGSPETNYSVFTILEIEGDSTAATGTIAEVINVGTTDTSGFWLGDLLANALDNGTISLLLVENFSGLLGDDLDTNDDGVLDVTPWSAVVDAVSVSDGDAGDLTYGAPELGPNYDGVSSFAPGGASRIPDGSDTDSAADWVRNDFDLAGIPGFSGSISAGEAYNTPGAPNEIFVPVTCDTTGITTPIYEIQGSGASSPLDGSAVVIDGIVVGDFQEGDGDHTDLDGFYVQDPTGDGDPATSDGIFVFAPGAIDVVPGDLVRVSGTVDEFFDMTEITNVNTVLLCGTGSVAPTIISVPSDLEPYEGMLITVGHTLYISEYFNYDRFGEVVLTPDRQYQPTAIFEPGSPDQAALAAANAANRITLDDGRTSQNPDPAIHPNGAEFTLSNIFRGGDSLDNVTGVIDYRFDLYRIQPTQGADYNSVNPRTTAPDPVDGSLQVASLNVLNYFNGDGMGGGFPTARGADDLEEFNRQRDKIIAAIVDIDADVIGLMEIENDGYDQYSAIADLVNGLNDATAPGTYAFIDPGVPVIGTDEIAVGLIYKPATVTPYGSSAILDSSVDARFDDDKNRPALAQSFVENGTNGIFTVVVNHLKSKGSPCDDVGDPDLGDGAGNCNITRLLAAEAMVDWLASDPTGSGDSDVLIIGDLNSYDKEDPIDAILAGSDDTLGTGDDYTDLLYAFGGELAYTYVFDGQLGYLDYALANDSLAGQVTGTTAWHINADEVDLIDYDTSFKEDAQDALYEPNAYRASDHDPVIVGLNLTPSLIRNGDGCYVVALEGSPFEGLATIVSIGDPGYNGVRFHAGRWGQPLGLSDDACYEIHGTDNSEIITGGLTNDVIFAYDGNDILNGLFGDDTFTGGAGADFINGNFGIDEILDFEPGIDNCFNVEIGC